MKKGRGGSHRNNFENVLVKSFNAYFEQNGLRGMALRLKMARYTPQYTDLLVLSERYNLAVECKSVEFDTKTLYFSQHFTTDKNGVHQLDRLADFSHMACLSPILALEHRRGYKNRNIVYLIPVGEVLGLKIGGLPGLDLAQAPALSHMILKKKGGVYVIPL